MNGWKVFGIIMMILVIGLMGTIYYFYTLGVDMVNSENHCSVNVCDGYVSYYYDSTTRLCYCNDEEGYTQKEFYIKK